MITGLLDEGHGISLVCWIKDMITGLLDKGHVISLVCWIKDMITGLLGQRTCYLTGLLDKRHDNWSVGTKDMLSHRHVKTKILKDGRVLRSERQDHLKATAGPK